MNVEPWPETVEAPLGSVAEITPDASLEPRWYAVRWMPHAELPEARVVGGIPLSDGSIVWRLFGVAVPTVERIIAVPSGVRIEFSTNVRPVRGRSPSSVARATQSEIVCEPVFGGEAIIESSIMLGCTPMNPDWMQEVQVRVEGLESSGGIPVPDLSLALVFGPGDEQVYEPPTVLAPPPVPAAMCAGVDCE